MGKKSFKPIKRVQNVSEFYDNKRIGVNTNLNITKDSNGIEDIDEYWNVANSIIGNDTINSIDMKRKTRDESDKEDVFQMTRDSIEKENLDEEKKNDLSMAINSPAILPDNFIQNDIVNPCSNSSNILKEVNKDCSINPLPSESNSSFVSLLCKNNQIDSVYAAPSAHDDILDMPRKSIYSDSGTVYPNEVTSEKVSSGDNGFEETTIQEHKDSASLEYALNDSVTRSFYQKNVPVVFSSDVDNQTSSMSHLPENSRNHTNFYNYSKKDKFYWLLENSALGSAVINLSYMGKMIEKILESSAIFFCISGQIIVKVNNHRKFKVTKNQLFSVKQGCAYTIIAKSLYGAKIIMNYSINNIKK